eukprot:GHVN01059285.1.p1 GENE.GHVN01059285.1~~GHVN01059285.1.p1  ORF type:complete len:737 (+),score=80.79 GHVN01059285.1:1863-4073(+)
MSAASFDAIPPKVLNRVFGCLSTLEALRQKVICTKTRAVLSQTDWCHTLDCRQREVQVAINKLGVDLFFGATVCGKLSSLEKLCIPSPLKIPGIRPSHVIDLLRASAVTLRRFDFEFGFGGEWECPGCVSGLCNRHGKNHDWRESDVPVLPRSHFVGSAKFFQSEHMVLPEVVLPGLVSLRFGFTLLHLGSLEVSDVGFRPRRTRSGWTNPLLAFARMKAPMCETVDLSLDAAFSSRIGSETNYGSNDEDPEALINHLDEAHGEENTMESDHISIEGGVDFVEEATTSLGRIVGRMVHSSAPLTFRIEVPPPLTSRRLNPVTEMFSLMREGRRPQTLLDDSSSSEGSAFVEEDRLRLIAAVIAKIVVDPRIPHTLNRIAVDGHQPLAVSVLALRQICDMQRMSLETDNTDREHDGEEESAEVARRSLIDILPPSLESWCVSPGLSGSDVGALAACLSSVQEEMNRIVDTHLPYGVTERQFTNSRFAFQCDDAVLPVGPHPEINSQKLVQLLRFRHFFQNRLCIQFMRSCVGFTPSLETIQRSVLGGQGDPAILVGQPVDVFDQWTTGTTAVAGGTHETQPQRFSIPYVHTVILRNLNPLHRESRKLVEALKFDRVSEGTKLTVSVMLLHKRSRSATKPAEAAGGSSGSGGESSGSGSGSSSSPPIRGTQLQEKVAQSMAKPNVIIALADMINSHPELRTARIYISPSCKGVTASEVTSQLPTLCPDATVVRLGRAS